MKKFLGRFFIGLAIFLGTYIISFGQTSECDPDQTLSFAEAEFSAGHFYSIPSILKICIDRGGFSQEQSVRAYLLLSQAYLIIDDPIAAEDSYLKLLKADPEYVADDKKDPIDIVYLSKKFTATPIFTPHFRVGFNTSFFRSIYSVTTEPYQTSDNRTLRFAYQLGAGIDWNISDRISLCVEAGYSRRSYKRTKSEIAGTDVQTVVGNQDWLDVPIYAKYADDKGLWRPFGYAGFAFNYLLSASNEFVFTDSKPTSTQLVAEGPNESITFQRNQLNRSWLVGGGVKRKIGKDFIYVDVRYMVGLSNMANESKIYYQDPSLVDKAQIGNPDNYLSTNVTRYRYVSDLFRMDNLAISFGFIKPLYDPRKVKRARTKSVSRQIQREEGGQKK